MLICHRISSSGLSCCPHLRLRAFELTFSTLQTRPRLPTDLPLPPLRRRLRRSRRAPLPPRGHRNQHDHHRRVSRPRPTWRDCLSASWSRSRKSVLVPCCTVLRDDEGAAALQEGRTLWWRGRGGRCALGSQMGGGSEGGQGMVEKSESRSVAFEYVFDPRSC